MGETTLAGTPEFDALRARLRGVQEGRGLPLSDIARRSDIAYPTLAAWLAGKYAGNNVRVAQQVEVWLNSVAEETTARAATPVLPTYVETPTAHAMMDTLGHAQFVPDIVVITGGAGVGKTTACRQYQATHPNVWMLTGEPACGSAHGVLEYVCDVLRITEGAPNRRSLAATRRVIGTGGLFIIDEAQHMTTAGLEQLRVLHDKGGIGLALVGNNEVFARLEGGGRQAQFAQLFSRVGMRLTRNRPLVADVDALLEAAGIAGAPERKLLRMVAAKPGALRGMSKLLRVAQIVAAADGGEMQARHLSEAWERLAGSAQIAEPA